MTDSCYSQQANSKCHGKQGKPDWLLRGSLTMVAALYLTYLVQPDIQMQIAWLKTLSTTVYELINTIWWGITIGIFMVAVLAKIPREFVISIFGRHGGFGGIVRATLGGVLLDLCSHGILMVAAKLYERGATAGQVIAFLVASPWNSFSLTIVLIALIGLNWALAFIGLSLVIAIISGLLFDWLVKEGKLPQNPNTLDLPEEFKFWPAAIAGIKATRFDSTYFKDLLITGIKDSRMVIRWILFGVVLAALIRAFVDTASFQTYFGPTLAGLGLTVLVATIIEVCSEGSTPIAADLLTRANAPGNSFAFLMTGVSTDYTEIMILKDTAKSWKFALFLPVITLPQVLTISWLINLGAT
ncbi:permease [Kordiimonas laminariae]|uniref:permease n=1 Tax=Kordiimonas laminariae TaxID=2917717 RepID=UPI001FF61861|nr:permease [Kordiimonas laminariae]MCK0071099.1 permease [Kordiimonas laminariae]